MSDNVQSDGLATNSQQPVIGVFCAASDGNSPIYRAAAHSFAQAMSRHNAKLVYGGGTTGLMGELSRTLVSLSGPDAVHGIMPGPLVEHEAAPLVDGPGHEAPDRDVTGKKVAKLPDPSIYGKTTIVDTMHQRKEMIAREVVQGGLGSGFVALPGGFGTLDEIAEMASWNQLDIHKIGVIFYSVEGFWDLIIQWTNETSKVGFIKDANARIWQTVDDAESVMTALRDYKPSPDRLKLNWESFKIG